MKKLKVTLGKTQRGKRMRPVIATASITISKDLRNALEFEDKDNNFYLKYKNKKLEIRKGFVNEEFSFQDKKGLVLNKNISIYKTSSTYKLLIPLPVINDMGITEDEREVNVTLKTKDNINYLEIVKISDNTKLEEEMENRCKVITIKVNKGGIGKTFVTTQLGYRLAELGNKVLVLTSDSQNNVHSYMKPYDKNMEKPLELSEGLKYWVSKGKGYKIELRKNLFFIPLENSVFGTNFFINLPNFIENMKKEYDYILIDSIPTMKIDSEFVKLSDKVIIPCFCDWVTVDGVIKVVEEAGVDKVLAVVINKYENKATQNSYLKKLKKALDGTGILLPTPIKNLSKIEGLLDKGKSIYESQDSILKECKESFDDIVMGILEMDKKEKEEKLTEEQNKIDSELDIDFEI